MRKWKCVLTEYPENWIVGNIYEEGSYEMLKNEKGERVTKESVKFTTIFEEVKEFDWNAFESENLAVHCRTEEEAIDFCKQMDNRGLEWSSGGNHTDCNNWCVYKKDTCYTRSMYSEIDFYKGISREIVEWRDYMKNEFTKADLKSGMVIVRRNGEICGLFDTKEGLSVQDDCESRCCTIKDYSNGLKNIMSNNLDIMEVYDIAEEVFKFTTENRELLWKRIEKSPAQLKLEELESRQREIADEIKKVREEL